MKQTISTFCPFVGFGDRPLNLLGHPYAIARTGLRGALVRLASIVPAGPLLDVGCGTMPYRALFSCSQPYEGMEIDQERNRANPRVTHFYAGDTFPLADESYAAILCSQVLEHSFTPERLLDECHRVLRPGGALVLTIPFLWPEHEQPWDSQRFTRFGLQRRLEASGFSVQLMLKLNPGLSALLQLAIELNESFERRFEARLPAGWPRRLFQLTWRLLWALPYTAFNLLGVLFRNLYGIQGQAGLVGLDPAQPWGPALYLDLVLLAVKSPPRGTFGTTTVG